METENSFTRRSFRQVYGRGSGLSSGRLWYAALVPLFGVYTELYASNKWLGMLVWGLALVMSPAACLLDLKYIRKNGHNYAALSPVYALIPPLYIFKRTKLTGDSSVCGAVWCIMAVYALIFNGFTTASNLKKSDFTGAIKENYWHNISELSDVTAEKTVLETLEELFSDADDSSEGDTALDWNAVKHKGYVEVTCSAGEDFGAEFRIDFDGYAISAYHLVSITENGKTTEGDKAADRIKELFPDDSSGESGADDSGDDTSGAEELRIDDEAA